MRYSLSKSTLLSGVFLLVFGAPAWADYLYWYQGGGGSCIDTCEKDGKAKAVISGQYKNLPSADQSFAVCEADAKGEGHRVGFNIVSSGAKCRVAHGDEGLYEEKYDCLCQVQAAQPVDELTWSAAGGGSCVDHCKRNNLGEAVTAGQYKNLPSEDQSFTVCRVTTGRQGNEGSRVGFNIASSGARCRFPTGTTACRGKLTIACVQKEHNTYLEVWA